MRFVKELEKISSVKIKDKIEKIILEVESSEKLSDIPNIKKLSGHRSAYRIKMGDYRIGIFVEGETVEFGRVLHRKDIYRVFP